MNKEEKLNKITETIIGVAINIHRALGPGLLESAYEVCMVYDLVKAGLKVEQQKPLPIVYRGVKLECGYRLDLMIENEVIVEIKSVEKLLPIHQAQPRVIVNDPIRVVQNHHEGIVDCMTGPIATYNEGDACKFYDFDADNDVDLEDWTAYQITHPDLPTPTRTKSKSPNRNS